MLDVCRALQGLGPAAYLPAGLTLLGSMYRPGPRKNLIFCIYGAMAPLGFFLGLVTSGLVGEYVTWPVFFWIGTGLAFLTTVIAYCRFGMQHSMRFSTDHKGFLVTIPNDIAEHKVNGVKMDWLGTITTISGLILFVFSLTDLSHAPRGFLNPYIAVTFFASLVILGIAFYIEGWVAEQPLLPFDVFKIR